jgi:hypothetical protein
MRVSGIQSGNFSGPVRGTVGQQPYRDGVTVREEQEPFRGLTPEQGYIELRARGVVTHRSMVAFWMVVFDFPEKSRGDDADALPALVVDHVRAYQR